MEYEITLRNHKAMPVYGRSERADWRHLADGALVARVDEDGGLGGAVQRAGRRWTATAVLKYRVRVTVLRG